VDKLDCKVQVIWFKSVSDLNKIEHDYFINKKLQK